MFSPNFPSVGSSISPQILLYLPKKGNYSLYKKEFLQRWHLPSWVPETASDICPCADISFDRAGRVTEVAEVQYHSTASCSHRGQNNRLYSKCKCPQQYNVRRFSCNSVSKTKKNKPKTKQKPQNQNTKNTTKQTKKSTEQHR